MKNTASSTCCKHSQAAPPGEGTRNVFSYTDRHTTGSPKSSSIVLCCERKDGRFISKTLLFHLPLDPLRRPSTHRNKNKTFNKMNTHPPLDLMEAEHHLWTRAGDPVLATQAGDCKCFLLGACENLLVLFIPCLGHSCVTAFWTGRK